MILSHPYNYSPEGFIQAISKEKCSLCEALVYAQTQGVNDKKVVDRLKLVKIMEFYISPSHTVKAEDIITKPE